MVDKLNLKAAFEKYMFDFYQVHKRFSFDDFGEFATTLLNYQINAQILLPQAKKEAAYYLTTLFNNGLGNRITEQDLMTIVDSIAKDYSLNIEIVKKITT